ncbi:acyl-CoA synthetase [Paramagnetospirillum kuznetsovii]|uniref:Acyl-CoA synthetase n=1 Tax=Paramagnetospirillum kuznetsovii TaxID=2053833 RepID=A0A364NYZ7_9PROT|nr:acyl-CoA synthetase [Paramagnetospirillum kuznetsovii]RAU22304.1 acyl-CoA synthetase [Paramagnetospirillum kuznetsovii]
MAKKQVSAVAQAKAAAAAKKGGKGGLGVNKGVVLAILAALVPFSLPSAVLIFFTMLPTLGSWATEKGPNKYAFLCVGGLNFSGLFPYLFGLWFGVHTLDEALRMVTDPLMLMTAYGCAALGWGLYAAMPPMVASYLASSSQRRVNNLKAAQKKLIDEWGDEVAKKT